MVKVQESLEPTVSEMERIIQEYRERINQALEIESNQLKEKAERESSQIIAKAKGEADKIVAQAKQEARDEAERIIAEAREEAEEIIKEPREEVAAARQESARVIVELQYLAAIIAKAEAKLQPSSEIQDQEAEINSRQATGEAVTPASSVSEKTEPAVPPTVEKRGAPIKESEDARLFKGCLKLEIISPFDQDQTGGVPEWLSRLHGLKIISTGGYARANRWTTTYTIDLEQPIPLLRILKAIPQVKDIAEHKGNIVLTLK